MDASDLDGGPWTPADAASRPEDVHWVGPVTAAWAEARARAGARVTIRGSPDARGRHDPQPAPSALLAAEMPCSAPVLVRLAAEGAAPRRDPLAAGAAAVRERLLRAAPHLVRPVPVVIELPGTGSRGAGRVCDHLRRARAAVEDSTLPETALDGRGTVVHWEARVDWPRLGRALVRAVRARGGSVLPDGPGGPERGEASAEGGAGLEVLAASLVAVRRTVPCAPRPADDWVTVRPVGDALEVRIPWPGVGEVDQETWALAPGNTRPGHPPPDGGPHGVLHGAASVLAHVEAEAGPPAAKPGRWRTGFAVLPGAEGAGDPEDPLWWLWGTDAVAIRAAARRAACAARRALGPDDLVAAEVDHTVVVEGARSVAQCMQMLAPRRPQALGAAEERVVRAAFERAVSADRELRHSSDR